MMINTPYVHRTVNPRHPEIDKYDHSIIGTNIKGKFSPLYSLWCRQMIPSTNRGYMYFKPRSNAPVSYTLNNYEDLMDGLEDRRHLTKYEFVVSDVSHRLFVSNGFIMNTKGEILLMLGVTDYDHKDNTNPEKYRLFVAKEFASEPLYKNVWKQVEKRYVTPMVQESGVDMEFISAEKIERVFFNGYPEINYSSISELEQIKKKYLEYFEWEFVVEQENYCSGHDYIPSPLFRPGYSSVNLKCTDPSFQPLIWWFITNGVYSMNEGVVLDFADFILSVEESNNPRPARFECDGYVFAYDPGTHDVIDATTGRRFHLMLSKNNLYKKCNNNVPQMLWQIQYYVNFVKHIDLKKFVDKSVENKNAIVTDQVIHDGVTYTTYDTYTGYYEIS